MRGSVREKKIVCSPVYQESKAGAPQGRESTEKQKRANQRAAERHFVQLVNANFVRKGVLLVDLTYVGGEEPENFERADRNMGNFLRRGCYLSAKRGGKPPAAPPHHPLCAGTDPGRGGGPVERRPRPETAQSWSGEHPACPAGAREPDRAGYVHAESAETQKALAPELGAEKAGAENQR